MSLTSRRAEMAHEIMFSRAAVFSYTWKQMTSGLSYL
jgi:hypothetical protein